MNISGKNIILGVTGGIAAYKAAELASLLVKGGASLNVVMTESAEKFVGPTTFQALSGHKVMHSVFSEDPDGKIAHIHLADQADLMIIAPATANTLARLAAGLADDMLATLVLAAQCPILIVPAMNVNMYSHPSVQKNLRTLEAFGYRFIGPDSGRLACGWTGKGRMVEPKAIYDQAVELLAAEKRDELPLKGHKVLVTAGPTVEILDPVRFFSNHSTGKMGYAIAREAAAEGAEVILISGPTRIAPPGNLQVIPVTSAREMHAAVLEHYDAVDAVVQSAAVADYRPESVSLQKIKKGEGPLDIRMVRNPDILRELGEKKTHQLLIGFAAETENLRGNAQGKLIKKNLDLLVANRVADGFASDTNRVILFFADGRIETYEEMEKKKIAGLICRAMVQHFEKSGVH